MKSYLKNKPKQKGLRDVAQVVGPLCKAMSSDLSTTTKNEKEKNNSDGISDNKYRHFSVSNSSSMTK
jgi:hypothetical protein